MLGTARTHPSSAPRGLHLKNHIRSTEISIKKMIEIRYPVLGAAYLGFGNVQLVHDKLAHFITFFILTGEFYFIFDTKHKSLKTLRLITFVACTVLGSIVSELVQNLVNSDRIFDINDILANVVGSFLGLACCVAYDSWMIRKIRNNRYSQLRSNNTTDLESNPESIEMSLNE